MGFARPPLDVLQRQVAQQAKSWRSPDIRTLAEVERYTRAAGQEQLARRAIKRQSENKSGKLVREEVANDQNDIEIASIIDRMALPTGIEPVFQP